MTSTAQCPSCRADQQESILCGQCCDDLETILAAAPALIAQLDLAASRQARSSISGASGKGSAHERSPVDWTAIQVRDQLETELAIIGTDIRDIRRQPWAGRLLHTLGTAITRAYRTIDRTPDRQYLGQCGATSDDLVCHAEVWTHPGTPSAVCGQCRTRHDVADRQATMLRAARDHLANATDIANALTTLDHPVTAARIRKWKQRGRLLERPEGSKLYRLGDVIDLLTDDHDHHRSTAS